MSDVGKLLLPIGTDIDWEGEHLPINCRVNQARAVYLTSDIRHLTSDLRRHASSASITAHARSGTMISWCPVIS